MISVVLPVYRTESFLLELTHRLTTVLESTNQEFELIFIDDGSPDGAWDTLVRLAKTDPRILGLRLSRNSGQHPAIAAGFDHARGDIVVLMDTDLQDCPEDLPSLLDRLDVDVDIVYTTKSGGDEDIVTRFTSMLYHKVFAKLTGTSIPKHIGTYRVFSRRVLEALKSYPEHNVVFGPLMFAVGFEYAIVEVGRQPRASGRSGYSFRKRLSLAFDSLLSYTDIPHRVLMWVGSIILFASVVYAVAILVRYFTATRAAPPGLTLIALLITLSLGSMITALGIVGMYVFRIYQEVLARPRYVVARTINIDPKPEPIS